MTLHVVFTVSGAEYALPVSSVLQMETFAGATPVPGAPSYVAGIVTVRGMVVPVIDLRGCFGLAAVESTLDTRIIVTESDARVVALRVDSAREVLELDETKHQPAPSVISDRAMGFIKHVHALGPRLFLLLDLPKILGNNSNGQPSPRFDDDRSKPRPQLPG